MNELIKVNYDKNRPTVLGRDLHELLEVKERYNDWFPRMVEYGFAENVDFISFTENSVKPKGGRPAQDHQLTIDMAKEICMLQRTERGKQARQYFIQLEKDWNSPEKVMARALQIANQEIESLRLTNAVQEQQIAEMKCKADYTDRILMNKGLVNANQIAKDYGMSAVTFNRILHDLGVQYKEGDQWLLYRKYQDKGYTFSETIDITRSDGRADVKMRTKWTQKGRLFLYNLLKENGYLPMIEQQHKTA